MSNLKELYYNKTSYSTDKGTTHSYIETYDTIFEKYKYSEMNILEVGVQTGGSLKLWNDYFPNAMIYGYDFNSKKLNDNNITDRVIYKVQNFNEVRDCEIGEIKPTIAIDDGSHRISDQLNFVKKVFPYLMESGVLIVEDIQNIEDAKSKFDELGYYYEIMDFRSNKNRYDDVLLIFRK